MTSPRPLREVFSGRRILVTGHTGFKGSWLLLWLHEMGADVTGYALAPDYDRSHFELAELASHVNHVEADLRDADALGRVFADSRPEMVFHLAAQALVRRSYDDPKTTFETNVQGSVNLLEAVRSCADVGALVYATSDKCYLNLGLDRGYTEADALGGTDPYSASKAAAEMVFSAYQHSFFKDRAGLGVASVRAGNVIGGGDWAEDRLIPDCVRALDKGTPIELRNPDSTRPWQHVLDSLNGYLQLAAALQDDPGKFSGAWNFGPEEGDGLTVRQLAEKATTLWGGGEIIAAPSDDDPFEHPVLRLNIDKAKDALGWCPQWGTERTTRESIQWYKEVLNGKSAWQVSHQQIESFEKN
jgi:CDP-glucose 4,6-dehydratase